MTSEYKFSDAECVKYLAQLDRLGIIELRPLNRYRLKVAKGFRWLPHGPVMTYFREHVAADYLSGAGRSSRVQSRPMPRSYSPFFLA